MPDTKTKTKDGAKLEATDDNEGYVSEVTHSLILANNDLYITIKIFASNLTKLSESMINKGSMEARMTILQQYWTQFQTTHLEITKEVDYELKKTVSYFTQKTFAKAESLVIDSLSFIHEKLNLLNPVNNTNLNDSALNPRQSDQNQSFSESRSRPTLPEYRLPRVDIPKFNGNYEQWPSFYDMFRTAIHDNNEIVPVHKLHFLKNSLLGEAAQLISHFQLTALNYTPAWNMLTHRYENKRVLINNQLSILFNQKPIQQDTAFAVKQLLDTTKKCMYAISNLGVDTVHWDVILIYLLVQKITKETHQLWEQSLNNSREIPTYDQITEFLEGRYRTLEIVTNDKPTYNRQTNRAPKVFHNQQTNNRNSANSCCLCSGTHLIRQCDRFKNMEIPERISFIKSKSMCLNCFASSHTTSKCSSKYRCFHCKKSHHSMLHLQSKNDDTTQNSTVSQSTPTISQSQPCSFTQNPNTFHLNNNMNTEYILLATAIVKITSNNGEEFLFRALLDQGSQASFITEAAASKLKLLRSPINTTISGIGNNTTVTAKNQTTFIINAHFQTKANQQVNALVLKTLTSILPQVKMPSGPWDHISHLTLADPQFHQPNKIDILLGADVYASLLLDGIQRGPIGSPTAQKTKLGWILSGFTSENSFPFCPIKTHTNIVSLVTHCSAEAELKRFWELESIPEKRSLTADEKLCEDFFDKTVHRDIDGRFTVRLLFHGQFGQNLLLGNSRPIACIRQQQLEKRFVRNPELKLIYSEVINDYLQQNHMQIIPPVNNKLCSVSSNQEVYLPHHVITKETSTTTKHRVVFNASQPTSSGLSLNDCFLVGPQLQDTLFALSLRFRKYKFAMTADIEKMYRQIRISDADTQYQKVVWRENASDPISDYRLLTVTFGTACAPYLAIKTIQHLAKIDRNKFPLASDVILNDLR